jgi:hypothetical protein
MWFLQTLTINCHIKRGDNVYTTKNNKMLVKGMHRYFNAIDTISLSYNVPFWVTELTTTV